MPPHARPAIERRLMLAIGLTALILIAEVIGEWLRFIRGYGGCTTAPSTTTAALGTVH